MERWPSGLRRRFAKPLGNKSPAQVRILFSPPIFTFCEIVRNSLGFLPARRRGLGRNAGGKKAEAGQFHSPRKIVCPAESKLVFRIFVKKSSNINQKTPPFCLEQKRDPLNGRTGKAQCAI
jgi:hypothetical protein